jgi:pyridoxal 5'-phosphate synthase pdxS subunit
MAKSIVEAVTFYDDPKKIAKLSEGIGDPMQGLEMDTLETKMAERSE